MQIQNTIDYELFETLLGNRTINMKKVDQINNDVQNGFNMLEYFPILVKNNNGKYGIIDGQHRFEVSKANNLPVYYLIANDISLKQIAQLNSRGEKWKPGDYLNCYIKLGIEDYKILQNILSSFRVQIVTAMMLLMNNDLKAGGSKELTEMFRSGDFKANFENETIELLELNDKLFGRYTFSNDRNLILALKRIKEAGKCDFEFLKSKIGQSPMMMDKQTDFKKYIYNIEQVYNFKAKERKVIY